MCEKAAFFPFYSVQTPRERDGVIFSEQRGSSSSLPFPIETHQESRLQLCCTVRLRVAPRPHDSFLTFFFFASWLRACFCYLFVLLPHSTSFLLSYFPSSFSLSFSLFTLTPSHSPFPVVLSIRTFLLPSSFRSLPITHPSLSSASFTFFFSFSNLRVILLSPNLQR